MTKAFGDWPKGPAVADTWPVPRTTPQPGVFEAVKADSTQSFVAVGHQGELLRTSPDYVPVTVMNEVLAGGFTSRLFGKIRTELGLAYSVGGSVNSNWTRVAPFQMQMSTRADATVKAIEALIAEAKAAGDDEAGDRRRAEARQGLDPQLVRVQQRRGVGSARPAARLRVLRPAARLARSLPRRGGEGDGRRRRARGGEVHPRRIGCSIVVVGPSEGRDKPLSALGTVKTLDITIPPPPGSAPAGAGASAGKPGFGSAGAAPSADAKAKGQALLAKAVDGFGGAAALDGVKSYVANGQTMVKTPQGEFTLQTKETLVPPDRFRQDMTLPMGQMAVVIAGPEAFMITPQGEQPMPASMRQQAEEQLAHVPLLLLRQRTQPGFEAVAAGEGKSGDTATALLAITFKGRTSTFGIDPQSGRVLTVSFRGAGPDGVPGDMVHTFSDFRPAGGLTVAFAQSTTLNGESSATSTLSAVTINAAVDDALWKRKSATP